MLLNVYAMIPFYMFMFNMSENTLLSVMRAAVPAIRDIGWSYALLAVLPFNHLKDGIVIALTFVIYRSLHVYLRFKKS
jgi:riboflavin transporter FmnP